ncbi:MAG TPA: 16S rRNA (adenine(1518)-N(6)/adenine(1519)-N(6))-dimethyltransferase RsmA [Pirellulales bacterium]|nr:16S rRNA (adenine(1518)-N(6)/adenine(1519)-N(6))-dimethyltransferase RsmA [Pirellulales bacterium]
MSSARQTQSFLIRRFEQVGITPKTRHGQNFLIDLNLLDVLFEAARIGPCDVVLEVGTGTGSLTAKLARAAAAVVSVELDPQMHQLASEELVDCDNVLLLRRDALKNKNHLNPDLLAAVRERLAAAPGRRFKLAANLPYNIATPIISNLLACDLPPATMTVTIQKELGDRIVARPSTKDYGALSVWMQAQCEVEIVRVMPPTAFWPRPKVYSAIVQIRLRQDWRDRIPDLDFFHSFARAMFFHRRKFLRSVILSGYKGRLDKPQVDAIMAELGFGETTRAEQLDVAAMLRLCEAVRGRL